MNLATLPDLSLSAAKLRIATEIDKLTGDSSFVWCLKSGAPLQEKINMLCEQYNDKTNPQGARNGLYLVCGKGLYEAVKNYCEKFV